jgi:hypothetical protein
LKVKKRREIGITIIMDESEAKWLKGIMQNPLYLISTEDKDKQDKKMRKMFWDILNAEGIEL